MPNVKLVTKTSEVVDLKHGPLSEKIFLGQSKLPKDAVKHFCDSFC